MPGTFSIVQEQEDSNRAFLFSNRALYLRHSCAAGLQVVFWLFYFAANGIVLWLVELYGCGE